MSYRYSILSPEISQLTCESRAVLLARGAVVDGNSVRPGGFCFGNVVLPAAVIRTTQRTVCPSCVALGGVSLCVWELRAYDVCHRHGVSLVDTCHGCGNRLSWAMASLRACACGFPIGQLPAKSAPAGRARLCAVLAQAMLTSIQWDAAPKFPTLGRRLPIDWALLLEEFLSKVMLPRFTRVRGMSGFDIDGTKGDELVAAMLEDLQYRDYVRDTLFLHAAAKPTTLLNSLRPGQDAQTLRARFDPCWRELSFHKSLWRAKQNVQSGTAHRAVRRLIKAGVLKAAGRDHMVHPTSLEVGPPAAWCDAEMPANVAAQFRASAAVFKGAAGLVS